MKLVPLPYEGLNQSVPVWVPFVKAICDTDASDPAVAIRNVLEGRVEVIVAWDEENQRAVALAGVEYAQRGAKRIAQIIWLTGDHMETWLGLLDDLELYLTKHQGCNVIEPIARPGWSRICKKRGYKISHVIMSKEFS